MRRVEVTGITPGCTLAKPVLDSMGRVLLRTGALVTPTVLTCLERWSIAAVYIDDVEAPPAEQSPEPTETHSFDNFWNQTFASHEENPEMDLIHRALKRWQSTRAATEKTA